MPALPRWGLARVRGRSMEPTLAAGDRLLVSYGARPAAGDVVLVRLRAETVAVKRVTAMVAGAVAAESDNATAAGAWSGVVEPDAVLAVVRLRVWPRPGRLPRAPGR